MTGLNLTAADVGIAFPVGPEVPLSVAFQAAGMVFLSGQLAFDESGTICGETIGEQTNLVFDRIETVLSSLQLSLAAVVKTTVWLAAPDLFAEFNIAYGRRLGGHRPARSTVVARLIPPGALVEIEAVALRTPERPG
jgi:2-iminobutanoate/2-iminopropanoate deaminase